MTNSECKKCHKPLEKGRICDACKQKGKDRIKDVGMMALGIAALCVTATLALLKDDNKKS